MPSLPRLQHLLDRYLHNTITSRELDEFWQLVSRLSDEDMADLGLSEFWDDPSLNKEGDTNWKKVYSRLQGRIGSHDIDYTKIIHPQRSTFRRLAVAASVLVVIAAALLFMFLPSRTKTRQPALISRSAFDLQVIRLPDGTIVTLNHNSKLDYPKAFDGATREVYLYGEGFFDVHHNASKPFLVHTGNLVVRVLGTAFNIKAYDSDEQIAVTVSRGKVQVQKNNTEKILGLLTAGDQLVVDKKAAVATQAKVDVKDILNWKTRDLVFDNKTVDEAAVIIGNYFGVEIKFEEEALRRCRFTASFSGEDDIGQVMNVITLLTGSSWKKDDEIIRINGKGCD